MSTDKSLTYRANLKAISGSASEVIFVGVHAEGFPTALYRLDVDKAALTEVALPCGGLSLLIVDETVYIGGDDSQIYAATAKAKTATAFSAELPDPATHLAKLSDDRIAALCSSHLVIIDAKGKTKQTIELSEATTAMAADPTGEWLALGDRVGNVSVYTCEGAEKKTKEFKLSETAKLHDAQVTAMLFEKEELRFLSAGTDQKLLLTHARGKLEPEDRGRGGNHGKPVTSIVHVPGDRFITSSQDRSCKTWAMAGATRPATLTDVPKPVGTHIIELHTRHHVAVACEDNTIRLYRLDENGKFDSESPTHIFRDAYALATNLLDDKSVARRGEAIHALAEYADAKSVELLVERGIQNELDHGLRVRGAELLAEVNHPGVPKHLESLLKHDDDVVRLTVFEGLRRTGGDNLEFLRYVLDNRIANTGVAAVEVLEKLAKKDDIARQMLIECLDLNPSEVRRTAMLSLESVYPKNSPEPTLIAAKSNRKDIRVVSLVQFYQRKLLGESRVQAAIRRMGEDQEEEVRQNAVLVTLLSNKKLADTLRARDETLHRQLFEFEQRTIEKPDVRTKVTKSKDKDDSSAAQKTGEKTEGKKTAKSKKLPAAKKTSAKLSAEDVAPLLSLMTSRMTDTSLSGATLLALLGDSRAFGTLLQLSREDIPNVRVQVCQALASLEDDRSLQRLQTMLNDEATAVRDAAYSGIATIQSKTPLDAADVGLSSDHADVRGRGLKSLVDSIRKSKAKKIDERARELLVRALNDNDDKVRNEAFKTCLNLKVDGEGEGALRFVMQSAHASVRREVLTEVMAQNKEPWATALLVELLSDPEPQIRRDAYEHLLAPSKGKDVEVIQLAFSSKHADIRKSAAMQLVSVQTVESFAALVPAINDEEKEIRLLAIEALMAAKAADVLRQAMSSQHPDVRVKAASARAWFKDEQAEAPLLELLATPEPEKEKDLEDWQQLVVWALGGIALLEDPKYLEQLLPLLDSKQVPIQNAAAFAIAKCVRPDHVDQVRDAMQHKNLVVKHRIALGLALCRDTVAKPLVFAEEAIQRAGDDCHLFAANAYANESDDELFEQLDSKVDHLRNSALLITLMRDWRQHDGTPRGILAALGSRYPRVRLLAARVLEQFGDEEQFANLLCEVINDRGEKEAWSIPLETVSTLADMFVFADPHTACGFIDALRYLKQESQKPWDAYWQGMSARYENEIVAAAAARAESKLPKVSVTGDELKQLAFGAYVGLVREQGGYHQQQRKSVFGNTVTSVREEAIRRIVQLAKEDETMLFAARPVLIKALGDPLQEVSKLAFEQLTELGLDDAARAEAALESGRYDLAVAGLELLTSAGDAKARKVLEDVLAERTDQLAMEVARLLNKMVGPVEASEAALESPSMLVRDLAIGWLVKEYDKDAKAKKRLLAAADSRYSDVRSRAADGLAQKKDKAAFDLLMRELVETSNVYTRPMLMGALSVLGDPRTPKVILDWIEEDKDPEADVEPRFWLVAEFRDPKVADQLLEMAEHKRFRKHAFKTLLRISGYDQPIEDPREEDVLDRAWMEKQHPRHDEVLAKCVERATELNMVAWLKMQIGAMRWSLSNAIDQPLVPLSVHPDEALRHEIVQAISFRLKHREAPAEPLLKLLEHRDPTTKFYAAEGLALGGRDEGIAVLLSAIELMSDLNGRKRAVLALGELADERSLEVLLNLAGNDGHALQDVAAQAIGHLGKSERADEVFDRLKILASATGTVSINAIVGLRWFNTPAAWDLIRDKARQLENAQSPYMLRVMEQLGYNDDPATQEIIIETIKSTYLDDQLFLFAFRAAKRSFGADSLEPDYAAIDPERGRAGPLSELHPFMQEAIDRVVEKGDPERMLGLVTHDWPELLQVLSNSLLKRDPSPVEAAAARLSDQRRATVDVAAQIVGRAASKKSAKPIEAALSEWLKTMEQELADAKRGIHYLPQDTTKRVLKRLVWASGRCGTSVTRLTEILSRHTRDAGFHEVRLEAANALADAKLSKAQLDKLRPLLHDPNVEIRQAITKILANAKASDLAEELVVYRKGFQILTRSGANVKSAAASRSDDANYQPIVLPQLIANKDVKTLTNVAENSKLADHTRLGAIEALGNIGNAAAEKGLLSLGKDEATDELLRKAAWRGLRRSKRIRAKHGG